MRGRLEEAEFSEALTFVHSRSHRVLFCVVLQAFHDVVSENIGERGRTRINCAKIFS